MVAAKSVRSKYWFVRFDGEKEFLRQKCEGLSRCLDTEAMLAAYHKGNTKENPHCHFVIELSAEIQKQSFAVRLKKHFGLEDKSRNYALDVWDGERGAGACSYLFHEEDVCFLVNKGFTQAEMDMAKAANEAVQKVVAVNKEKASMKLVDRALEEFTGKLYSRTDILAFMIQLCRRGDHYWPGSFMIKKYVEEVEIRLLESDEGVWDYAQRLENSLWR